MSLLMLYSYSDFTRELIQALVGDCDQLTSTTTTESTTTNGEFIPDYQCTASHPCPEGYCCWWDEKMCVLEAAVGSCDIFTTAATTMT